MIQYIQDISFVKQYWSQIVLMLGSVVTFFIGKRGRQIEEGTKEAEQESVNIKNLGDLLDVYKEMHLDLGIKVKSITREYDELEKMYKVMKERLFNYELKVRNLEKENKELRELLTACENECRTHLKNAKK